MKLEFKIARRILFSSDSSMVARPIVNIALISVALGLSVMLLAVMIVTGFKREITLKVAGFGSHIQVGNFSSNETYESEPMDSDSVSIKALKKNPVVKHIQAFATKPGIIKTDSEIQGIVLKGVGPDFNATFFNDKLVDGSMIDLHDSSGANDVIISKHIAQSLNLKTGSKIKVYFIQQPPRIRVFHIKGIYETGLEEFDKIFVYCRLNHIQKLNGWQTNQVGGYEIEVNDLNQLDKATALVYNSIGFRYTARSIKEIYPQIFNWLILVDSNVVIIIWLMIIVVLINMISTLLIIVLDNTSEIGILKALGATNGFIIRVFLIVSFYLVLIGVLLGNLFAFGLGLFQQHFKLFKLDQESYYINHIPVDFTLNGIVLVNFLTVAVCMVVLLLPAMVVSGIRPVNSIKFE